MGCGRHTKPVALKKGQKKVAKKKAAKKGKKR